jgi:hypothetical protein
MLSVPNHQHQQQAPREPELGPETKLNFTAEGRAIIAAEIARYMEHCLLTETPWFPVSPKASHDSGIGG